MTESSSKYQMNRDSVGENETLFDFLKRKKKYNLEGSVNKTLTQHSQTKKKLDVEHDSFINQRDERTKATNYQSNNEAKRGTRQNITPKKIEFQEMNKMKSTIKEISQTQPIQGKSFLSMISPLKNKKNMAEDVSFEKENISMKQNKKLNKENQTFSKKNITKCINTIKSAMNSFSDSIRNLKQKSHGLVIQFNPFFNQVADTNSSLSKQVGDFRNKLRGFESMIENIDTQNTDEILQLFHKNLEEHLQFQEGQLKKLLEKTKNEEITSIQIEKDRIIDQLRLENRKLSKQVEILSRRLERAENHHQNLEEAVTERQIISVQQIQRLNLTYEANIQKLKQKNQQLVQQCQLLTQSNKNYEKQLKDCRFAKQSEEERRRQEIQRIIEAKDAYLLNQIMVLKAQFSSDLNRINELHKIKEAELQGKIAKRQQELNRYTFQRGCDKQIQGKILEEANQIKQENTQLKLKVECIITDMYRMNEQLYQHWMALKDIKALSNRLGSFAQYRKIYQDLLFNDHLFH